MPRYVIWMLEDDGAWEKLPGSEQSRLLGLYGAWVRDLRARGAFVDGWPLGRGGSTLCAASGEVVAAPYDETKGVATGMFVVEAPDLASATDLARGCPALLHGERLIVRPVGHV